MADYALELDDAAIRRFMLAARLAEQAERDQWAVAGIKAGAAIADIGCGPGAITVLLRKHVEPAGRVHAIDRDGAALAIARQLAKVSGTEDVLFGEGDAAATGLAPESFDVVMVRHVLGHDSGRQREIVDHLRSLLRKGGCLYLVDTDLTGTRVRPPDPDLRDMWARYAELQIGLGNDLCAGLGLGDLILGAGLELTGFRGRYDIFRENGFKGPAWEAREAMSAAGLARPEDLVRWQEAFERLEAAGNPPALLVPMFTATGRRAV